MSNGYYFGIIALIVFWIFSYRVTGDFWPWALAISEGKGKEGKAVIRASKFQALIWTLITLFAYSSIFYARFLETNMEAALQSLPTIPINLLVLMGFSVATAAGSKSVTISYKTQGYISEDSGGLISDPKEKGDLVKTQMLIWTVIGAVIYMMSIVNYIASQAYTGGDAALPDIDGALLVLMGVSQGSYLGNKLVSRDVLKKPKISDMLSLEGPAGTEITILGENFGANQEENFVVIHDRTIRSNAEGLVSWNDNQIRVKVPSTFKAGDKIAFGVYRDNMSSNKLKFEVT